MATAKKTTTRTRRSPQRRSSSDWYRVSEPGGFHAAQKDGTTLSMTQGQLVRGSHPAVKAYPQFFERMDDVDRPEVESATAAPGEQR